jgi:hypothetical protein
VLRKSHLSAEFTFTPALTSIDVSVTNSAATRTNTTNTFCISIQRIRCIPGRYGDGDRVVEHVLSGGPEKDLQNPGANSPANWPKILDAVRFASIRFDKELFTELWVPFAGNMTVGELEAIAGH